MIAEREDLHVPITTHLSPCAVLVLDARDLRSEVEQRISVVRSLVQLIRVAQDSADGHEELWGEPMIRVAQTIEHHIEELQQIASRL